MFCRRVENKGIMTSRALSLWFRRNACWEWNIATMVTKNRGEENHYSWTQRTRSSLITGSPYKDQLTKSLEKSSPKKTSLSVPGVRNRPGGRGGKTKGLQKKKIRPTKRYHSSSDSSNYYDPPLVDSDDDINDGDKPDSRKATCIFSDGKFSEDTRGEVWVKCVMCQMLAHLDCAGVETASYICDFCK
ncbi:hypothetical protein AVEN_129415-1 [Araneus ventricosus]|uniref:Zinc finger PHD-type domain-containing protein n=1 Tax=Araneus ventricosus TaxID=182803 RepID=A0A4Y2NFI7_ARAVE|nr:hypothetical protein AVEN_129415-1 [Araneus ventricosus]